MASNTATDVDNEVSPDSIITDGTADIAKQSGLARMMVEADGRRPFQKVWLWGGASPGGKKPNTTSIAYNPETDGPQVFGKGPILPGLEELGLQNTSDVTQYLEVGLVRGGQPNQDHVKNASGKRAQEIAQQQNTIHRRDEGALRAFIAVSELIAPQAKFFVGCRFEEGRLYPRAIEARAIFFYAEFWTGIEEGTSAENRLALLAKNAKYHAAITKNDVERIVAPIVLDVVAKDLTEHPLAVTRAETLVSMLILQQSFFTMSPNMKPLNSMIAMLEASDHNINFGPYTKDRGVSAFMDFGQHLTHNLCDEAIAELKSSSPDMADLDHDLVMIIHQDLSRRIGATGARLGHQLRRNGLDFFLETCQLMISSPDATQEVRNSAIKQALAIADTHVRRLQFRSGMPKPVHSTPNTLRQEVFCQALLAVQYTIETIALYSEKQRQVVTEKHGGVLRHKSFEDLMMKLGQAQDITTVSSLFEQLGSFHVAWVAAQDKTVSDALSSLRELLRAILEVTYAG